MRGFPKLFDETLYANNKSGTNSEPALVLYDDHRSHIFLTSTDWAKTQNVILFVHKPCRW